MDNFERIKCCINLAGDEYHNIFRSIVGHHPFCPKLKELNLDIGVMKKAIDGLYVNADKQVESLKNEVTRLRVENKKMSYLFDCADYIGFVAPDVLERDHSSLNENDGKWQYQREWMLEPITGFETAIEAFDAMQNHSENQK